MNLVSKGIIHPSLKNEEQAKDVVMKGKANRVLWLLNHTTLRASELPLLRSLDYEVYCPKIFPDTAANRSASVDWSWDKHLTIPEDDLAELNAFDFYEGRFSPRLRALINEHFETAIFAYMFPMFNNLISYFDGRLVLRAFGLTSDKWNYYDFAKSVGDPGFTRRLGRVLDRFWFGQAYPHLDTIEPPLIRQRAAYLPLGLPDKTIALKDRWTGGLKQVLFVCPEIKSYDETSTIYKDFKKHFGSLPHVICGNQSIPVDEDKSVLGRLDQAAYERLFLESTVMFYHSKLPRHLHYHPLEAMSVGMPVVYMKQGLLGELGGRGLPGACSTIDEARHKIMRILEGDTGLIRAIRASQPELMKTFDNDSILENWKQTFVEGIMATKLSGRPQTKTVAILSTQNTSIEQLSEICEIVKELQADLTADKQIKFVVGVLDLPDSASHRLRARFPDINIRPFSWKRLDAHAVRRAQELEGTKFNVEMAEYLLPDDGVSQFMECDAWVIFSDLIFKPMAPIKPSVIVSRDLSRLEVSNNRISPSEEASFAAMARAAVAVFSPSSATLRTFERQCGVQKGFSRKIGKTQTRLIQQRDFRLKLIWLTGPDGLKDSSTLVSALKYVLGVEKLFVSVTVVSRWHELKLDFDLCRPTEDSPREILRLYEQLRRSGLTSVVDWEDRVDVNRWQELLEDAGCVMWPEWSFGGLEFLQYAALKGVPIVSHESRYIEELTTVEQLSPTAMASQKTITDALKGAADRARVEREVECLSIDPVTFHKELLNLL